MTTKRFEQIALAQLLVGGCAVVFGVCILIEHAQAQPVFIPHAAPPPVFNPSSPNTVPQPSYTPQTPSTPSIIPRGEVTSPVYEEPPSTTARPERGAKTRSVHHHRGRSTPVTSTRSDEYPTLNVAPMCHGITNQSDLQEGLRKVSFDQCIQAEQVDRETMIKEWSTFSADDKRHCIALATTGGESSYTELLTCLEMARDVRALRSAEATSSKASTTQARSSPSTPTVQPAPATPTVQPAPADSASRPPSTNEPPKMGADSTLKELERVKADALNARASEAMVRGKLAGTEADLQRAKQELQRAKEEAGRATREAEQAKADAKVVRDAKAEAERKLADAETARTAAEERQRTSEGATKSEPGPRWLPSWLRSWFEHKPSNP
jgi:hypothetical protein